MDDENMEEMLKKVKKKLMRSLARGDKTFGLGVEVNTSTGKMRVIEGEDNGDEEYDIFDGADMEELMNMTPQEIMDHNHKKDDEMRSKNKIEKTFPTQVDWDKRHEELTKMGMEMLKLNAKSREFDLKVKKLQRKTEILRNGLWADIRAKLEIYEGHLHWNEKNKEVELYADEDKKPKPKAVKSPFQKL